MNQLFYGDNLDVMRQNIPSESVDLVYLDPPFNSNRDYNVIFARHDVTVDPSAAQIQAFGDTWRWTPITEGQYEAAVSTDLPRLTAEALRAFRALLGENDAMAYLVNMAPRLVEMYRVLKQTGTIYLHCDPTMSHYLKVLLDTIFGADRFGNEISWAYKYGGRSKKHFGRKHDVILRYTKSNNFTFNSSDPGVRIGHEEASLEANFRYVDEDGRRYREGTWSSGKKYRYYADEGRLRDDVWTDINSLHQADAERLGYPTQKPVALLELIIRASSNPGDVVLDPFCGCGTTIDAAVRLDRRWIGIDITYIAIDLIGKRLRHTHGDQIMGTYDILGIPRDKAAALALFSKSPFDFERWAVSLVNGQPNQRQVGDKGVDGIARFPLDARGNFGRILISVKGGKQLNPAMVRDLGGTISAQHAEMGVLIINGAATRGMIDAANHAGSYQHPRHAEMIYPRIQIVTTDELLSGNAPKMPPTVLPYIQALRAKTSADQASLFE